MGNIVDGRVLGGCGPKTPREILRNPQRDVISPRGEMTYVISPPIYISRNIAPMAKVSILHNSNRGCISAVKSPWFLLKSHFSLPNDDEIRRSSRIEDLCAAREYVQRKICTLCPIVTSLHTPCLFRELVITTRREERLLPPWCFGAVVGCCCHVVVLCGTSNTPWPCVAVILWRICATNVTDVRSEARWRLLVVRQLAARRRASDNSGSFVVSRLKQQQW